MNIINLDQLISMTSKEIAELTGKRHDNVIRDVRKMLDEIYPDGGLLSFEDTYVNTQNGETYSMYRLDRKHTFILVSGYSVQLRAKCYDHIQMLEQKVLRLEDQQKRAAVQSANRRGVTWGDYCKTHGLPAQKLMNILKRERKLFQVHPVSGEWSVNPKYAEYFRVIKPTDQRFNPSGINIRFNAKGLEFFGQPEHVLKMRGKVIEIHGTDAEKQKHLQDVASISSQNEGL
ncbi:Rha family transcriptional regulator [Klebsiella pneumoniae]|uniref:Rha family transcriptional regulator n=1 Tax=Klebsiella spallanzanii TaxID=2587528 RepID=A0A564IB88_9ENTR|nr:MULTISPECIES: Rha family transcriptional regulator [Enterobacteriaceae]EIX9475591.1 Rha family transcriptional regulator [Klebsiella pneumoniae]EKT9687354.1 Rha family transcriptional regulator [Klebsiella pneumoniae]MBD7688434.1 Rha family transcriptional regulator [Klebsiella pneumoniae]MBM0452895.1 Rha family transcriptional regulator [Klebsiella pneumoniae]MBM0459684.1 Rha family transcriptional regulator [Klebsiella pneumoniae]